jgi:hypothetical protein
MSFENGKIKRINLLVRWRVGVLACWRVGVLACWRVGVLACWRVGVLACFLGNARNTTARAKKIRQKAEINACRSRVRTEAQFIFVTSRMSSDCTRARHSMQVANSSMQAAGNDDATRNAAHAGREKGEQTTARFECAKREATNAGTKKQPAARKSTMQ